MLFGAARPITALHQPHADGANENASHSRWGIPRVPADSPRAITRASAASRCLAISEMRRAIIDWIDDDDDLLALATVSHAWHEDIANGPVYRNVLRRLLHRPGGQDRLPDLPDAYSALNVVLLLRQVQSDPYALQTSHPDMIWLRGFLAEHYPLMLGYFDNYQMSMQTALWQGRRDAAATAAAQGLTGLAYGIQCAVCVGMFWILWHNERGECESVAKFVPLLFVPATFYAVHTAIQDIWGLVPEKSDLPACFDNQKQALQHALRPRSLSGLPAPAWGAAG